MAVCKKCNGQLKSGAKFCGNCGEKTSNYANRDAGKMLASVSVKSYFEFIKTYIEKLVEKIGEIDKKIKIAVTIIILAVICISFLFIFSSKSEKQIVQESETVLQKDESNLDNSFVRENITNPDLAYIPVKAENGLYKYIFINGKAITDAAFKTAYMFSEGLAMVQLQDDSYAFIDTKGKQIACCYQSATPFKEGVAWVLKKGENITLINSTGKVLGSLDPNVISVRSFYEGYSLFVAYGKQSFIDKKFGYIGGGLYYEDVLRFQDDLAGAKCENGKYGFIDKSGKFIIDCVYDEVKGFRNGLAVVKNGKNWGAINKSGDTVITLSDNISMLIADGNLFRYQDAKTKKWGWLNSNGQVFKNAIFDESNPFFDNTLAPVKYNGLWGFMNKNGDYVIGFQFKYAYPFYNERAIVQFADESWGTIDANGNIKLKIDYTLAPSYWNLAVSAVHSGPKLSRE